MSHVVEEESGTYVSQFQHSHNGYHAGDFSAMPVRVLDLRHLLVQHAA